MRNSPMGGALNEIDFYIAVNRCDGLGRGFYYYDSTAHALGFVAGPCADLDDVFSRASKAIHQEPPVGPDVVIVLASRQARLSQKYKGVAQRLTTIHVGVIYEALYLAAADLKVSPCAIGFSDLGSFAALTGRDPMEETSVGEFALSGPYVAT